MTTTDNNDSNNHSNCTHSTDNRDNNSTKNYSLQPFRQVNNVVAVRLTDDPLGPDSLRMTDSGPEHIKRKEARPTATLDDGKDLLLRNVDVCVTYRVDKDGKFAFVHILENMQDKLLSSVRRLGTVRTHSS